MQVFETFFMVFGLNFLKQKLTKTLSLSLTTYKVHID